ncbi:MAG: 2-hydroxyacyl-CoA dehydratase family protein [Bacteroidetes bacterium]|nr:2-hydroxyacyl-CoA dehydratase family protein [Bacteroidota bacterium]MCL5025665.1 2-hydroxyacyl-CoA dehydratase family protein [Chloroflexota bacterium]
MTALASANHRDLVGITTTLPVEVVFAAGLVPVDLNNVFVTSSNASAMVEMAEQAGFPRTTCSWVKGIYGAVRETGLRRVIGVVRGDCSNTEALLSVLAAEGVEVFHFSYPYPKDYGQLREEIERLMMFLGVEWPAVERAKACLDRVRALVHRLDDLTWQSGVFSGLENHYYCVNCSDFRGDPAAFEREVAGLLASRGAKGELARAGPATSPAATRRGEMADVPAPQSSSSIRLGFVGVPPIIGDLYPFLESHGASVVYNEMQRQFAMPSCGDDLVQQYLDYTYPYGVEARLADIRRAVQERRLAGLVHYVQSFCHHQIEDMLLRRGVPVPVLTLEGDRPGPLDGRSKTRIEAFLERLS